MSFYGGISQSSASSRAPGTGRSRPGWFGGKYLANWLWQAAAFAIDSAPLWLLWWLCNDVWSRTSYQIQCDGTSCYRVAVALTYPFHTLGLVISLAWLVFNSVIMLGRTGQSLGMRVLGLYVGRPVYVEGDQMALAYPDIGFALVRMIVNVVSAVTVIGLISYLWPIWGHKRQTFGDMAANTLVFAVR